MSWPGAIPYGEAVGKAIWNYFGLSDYLKLKISKYQHGMVHYDDVHELWDNAIRGDTYDDGDLILKRGRIVRLIDFTFTEWFPWLPGMYWSPYGYQANREGDRLNINKGISTPIASKYSDSDDERAPLTNTIPNIRPGILAPMEKTLSVISGIGAVRMDIIDSGKGPIKVVGATRFLRNEDGRPNVSGGVPVVMARNAYEKISRVETVGVVKATVEGRYVEIPAVLDNVFRAAPDIPRFCIFVGSELNIELDGEGDDVTSAGWTLYEDVETGDYNLAFGNFHAANVETGPRRAGSFLRDYIQMHRGMALTEFDERSSHFEAAYKINEIARGNIDIQKFRRLVYKIRQKYPLTSYHGY